MYLCIKTPSGPKALNPILNPKSPIPKSPSFPNKDSNAQVPVNRPSPVAIAIGLHVMQLQWGYM